MLCAPVEHALDSFLLPSDDDRVRILREMLRGPVGRLTASKQATADYFWTGTEWGGGPQTLDITVSGDGESNDYTMVLDMSDLSGSYPGERHSAPAHHSADQVRSAGRTY